MPFVRVKGFQIFKDRHGKQRCYHRKTKAVVDLNRFPMGSAEFLAECARIAGLLNLAAASRPGTLGGLIVAYRSSPTFQELAPAYPARLPALLRLSTANCRNATGSLRPPADRTIRDKAAETHKRRFANYVRTALSILFSWGLERGYVHQNTAKGIKNIRRERNAPRANGPWTDAERYVVLEAASWALKVPIALAMFLGLREGDALAIPRSAYDGSKLDFVTNKTGQRVCWPVSSSLKDILDGAPNHEASTLAANSYGQTWTDSGFRGSWGKLRTRLEKDGKVQPGLTTNMRRHTVATNMREEGFDERTIADALGQKTDSMARHYSRDADLSRKMTAVAERMDVAENKRRSEVVKPTPKSVKP